jgi:L-aspartate oxidase
VWLDLRPIHPDTIRRRFPNIIQVCKKWGVDVFHDPIPVAPAAHYWMGGIAVDLDSQSTVAGLYAVGETANTGVHGANRLASNSLLECLVFGAQLRDIQLMDKNKLTHLAAELTSGKGDRAMGFDDDELEGHRETLKQIRKSLPELIWASAGICRDQETMNGAIAQVQIWQDKLNELSITSTLTSLRSNQVISLNHPSAIECVKLWGETRNLLEIAHLILKSAQFRKESRGGHYRRDFPNTLTTWEAHTLVQDDAVWRSPLLSSQAS